MAALKSSSRSERAANDLPRFRYAPAVAILLLALMGFRAGGAAFRESATFDEIAHLGAGLSYLQKFDLRLNEEHPPLAKIIAAIPLVLRGTRADYNHPSWTVSSKFLPDAFFGQWLFGEWVLTRWNDPARTLAWGRLPMLLLTLALGWVIFLLGRKIGGDWGGLLSVSAYASTPTFIVFGPLVLTDLGVTLFCLLALWRFAVLGQSPSRRNMVLFSLCLAAALLTKFSSGLLFFAFGAVSLNTRFFGIPGADAVKSGEAAQRKAFLRAWRRERWRWTLKGIVLAAAVVYAFYFVFSLNQSTDALYLIGHGAAWVPVRRLLMPPWLYLRGLLLFAVTASRPTFILGHGYAHGVWFFFPVMFLLKSTLGFLGLLAVLLALSIWNRRGKANVPAIPNSSAPMWRVIWVSLIVFTAACMLSSMTISIRHFMVPIVLLIVMLAALPKMIQNLVARTRAWGIGAAAATAILAASSLASVAMAYPNYFPFFNSLTRSHPLYWWASDSNVDWDQALPQVRQFADRHGLRTLNLDAYGMADPTVIVPQARLWDCQQPKSEDAGQWVVVSSNMILDQHNCIWLMQYPHQSIAGGSMWAVKLPSVIPPTGAPGGPPPASEDKVFLSMPQDMRPLFVNLTRHPEQFSAFCEKTTADMKKQLDAYRKQHGW